MFSLMEGPIIGFAAADLLLSICLLALFAYPLYQHLKLVNVTNEKENKLLKLLKKNLILSFVIMTSTFCNLLAMM